MISRPIKFLFAAIFFMVLAAPAWAIKASLVYDGDVVSKVSHNEYKGVDYLPLKSVANLFKAQTQWMPVAEKAVFQCRNRKIIFLNGKKTAEIGSDKIEMDGPARYTDGTLYVPASFFAAETFARLVDCKVEWNSDTLTLSAQRNVSLYAPRITSKAASTRVVFESTEPIEYEDKLKGRIITIDVPKATIAQDETIRIKDPVVSEVSLVKAHKGAVLKIDLAQSVTHYTASLSENPYRLTVNIRNPKAPEAAEEEQKLVQAILEPEAPLPVPAVKSEKPKNHKEKKPKKEPVKTVSAGIRKIVVDAGHGGEDTGAIGKDGTKEKDINLMVALELARELRLEGHDVFMTRKSDVFISLSDRSLMANQEGADLFISVHCNAAPFKRKEGGFEIYFLSEDASDQHAEDIARFENMEPERSGLKSDSNRRATEVLFSMARTEFINESSLLCHMVSHAVNQRVPIDNRGVKQADFHVLHGVQMPSILVEMAFIDHPPEEKKLRQRKFRSAMVDSIVTGVQNFESKYSLLK